MRYTSSNLLFMATSRLAPLPPVETRSPSEDSWESFRVETIPNLEDEPLEERSGERLAVPMPDGMREAASIRARIAQEEENPQEAWQKRQDRLKVKRYDERMCRAQELLLMLRARLALVGVAYDAYDARIEQADRPLRGEQLQAGKPTFQMLATEYNTLRRQLEAERKSYEAICKQFHLPVEEAGSRRNKTAKKEVTSSPFVEKQHEMAAIYENIAAKHGQVAFEDATTLHEMVVQTLQGLKLSKEQEGLAYEDRRALLLTRYLCERIESQLDQVRVREMREVDRVAEEAQLVSEVGNHEQAAAKRAELAGLLTRLAPLYLLEITSPISATVEVRMEYHLMHAQLKELATWVEEGRIPRTEAIIEKMDRLQPPVESLRQQAYPHGRALGSAPLEAYSRAAA
jgi:hypothetical protein